MQRIRVDSIKDKGTSYVAGRDMYIYQSGESTDLIIKLLKEIFELKEKINHYKKRLNN